VLLIVELSTVLCKEVQFDLFVTYIIQCQIVVCTYLLANCYNLVLYLVTLDNVLQKLCSSLLQSDLPIKRFLHYVSKNDTTQPPSIILTIIV